MVVVVVVDVVVFFFFFLLNLLLPLCAVDRSMNSAKARSKISKFVCFRFRMITGVGSYFSFTFFIYGSMSAFCLWLVKI